MKRALILLATGWLVVTVLAGCATTLGPKVLNNAYVDYNETVRKVVGEEVLLNIVRRRYYESPQFTTIASIVTQSSNAVSAGVGGSGQFNSGGVGVPNSTAGVSGNLNYAFSDSPAISIVPQTGQQVAQQLTQRIFYDTPGALANVGYPYDLVLALTVECAGNVCGPQFGPEKDFRPGSREYVELIQRIRSLIDKNQLRAGTIVLNDPYADITYPKDRITIGDQMTAIGLGPNKGRFRSFDGGKTYYFTDQNYYSFLWIDEPARDTEDGRRVIELLNVVRDPLRRIWKVEGSHVPTGPDYSWQKDNPPRDILSLWPRSFYSVLNLLAFSVQVPEEEVKDGRAFSLEAYAQAVQAGLAVDLARYLKIHWSKDRPSHAFAAIQHRGKWFYVDDRDADSKRVFNVIYDLFNITIAPAGAGAGPILTLPLGR